MPLLQEKDRNTLRDLAKQITSDVTVTLYTQRKSPLVVPGVVPCETCEHAEQLVTELSEIMPKLTVEIIDFVEQRERAEQDKVDHLPTLIIAGAAERRVRFIGFPAGYEAATLITAIMQAGGAADAIPKDVRSMLDMIDKPIDLKVFVTPT